MERSVQNIHENTSAKNYDSTVVCAFRPPSGGGVEPGRGGGIFFSGGGGILFSAERWNFLFQRW